MNPKHFIKNNLFSFVISTAFMAALCAIAFVYSAKAGIFSSILLACYLVYVFIFVYFGSGDAKNLLAGKSLAAHTFDFISGMNLPCSSATFREPSPGTTTPLTLSTRIPVKIRESITT